MKVLVLNADYRPYAIWSWQKCMTKLFAASGPSIDPIYGEDGKMVRHDKLIRDGSGLKYEVPKIVVMRRYQGNGNRPAKYSKGNVYARDLNRCQYCGDETNRETRSVDHVIPRAHWNPRRYSFQLSSFENVVTACKGCNLHKRNRTPQQANMKLIRKPRAITVNEVFSHKIQLVEVLKEWLPYLK